MNWDNVANGVGAGTSIFGSLFNLISQRKNNQLQMQLQQQAQAWQEDMMMKQLAYNEEMWNKQNAYNTPLAQRQRMEEAGFNPYMMMDGSNAGAAGSANGITTPSAIMPNVTAPQFDSSSIVEGFNHLAQLIFQRPVRDANTRKTTLEGDQLDFTMPSLVSYWNNFARYWRANAGYREKELSIMDATMEAQKKQIFLQNYLTDQEILLKTAQISSVRLSNDANETLNKYLDGFQRLQYMMRAQELANLVSQGKLTEASAVRELASAGLLSAQTKNEGKRGVLLDQEANLNHQKWLDGETQRQRNKVSYMIEFETAMEAIKACNARYGYESEYYGLLNPAFQATQSERDAMRDALGDPFRNVGRKTKKSKR